MDRLSVVIPTYNRAHLVGRAVSSALAALEPGDEVIVVDDGSVDQTAEVVRRFSHPVRSIRGPHRGPSAARNLGVREARNPLIAFLDSDDVWTDDRAALGRAVMTAFPELAFCFSNFRLGTPAGGVRPDGLTVWNDRTCNWREVLGRAIPFSSIAPLPPGRTEFGVHIGDLCLALMEAPVSYILLDTTIVRRTVVGDALHFRENLRLYEDYECFGRLAARGLAGYMDCETATQCCHQGERLTDAEEYEWITARIQALEGGWGANPEFLARHGRRYARVIAVQYKRHARWLLRRGRTAEARRSLRAASEEFSLLGAISMMPPGFVRRGIAIRDALRLKPDES